MTPYVTVAATGHLLSPKFNNIYWGELTRLHHYQTKTPSLNSLPTFQIITTRSYDERLQTLSNVREAGISVCSGGIIGLGEQHEDRVGLLYTLATLPEHPESVPVNALLAVEGTPLEGSKVRLNVLRGIGFGMVKIGCIKEFVFASFSRWRFGR